jgi:hypothetical protein
MSIEQAPVNGVGIPTTQGLCPRVGPASGLSQPKINPLISTPREHRPLPTSVLSCVDPLIGRILCVQYEILSSPVVTVRITAPALRCIPRGNDGIGAAYDAATGGLHIGCENIGNPGSTGMSHAFGNNFKKSARYVAVGLKTVYLPACWP